MEKAQPKDHAFRHKPRLTFAEREVFEIAWEYRRDTGQDIRPRDLGQETSIELSSTAISLLARSIRKKGYSLPVVKKNRRTAEEVELDRKVMMTMYNAGLGDKEIAQQMGLEHGLVIYEIPQMRAFYGLAKRPRSKMK